MKKRILSILLVAIVLITMLPTYIISSYAEVNCDFEYNILDDGTAEITDYIGSAIELEIPSEIDGYTVTKIGHMAFFGCTSLISVTIPSSITSIGASAFGDCTSLNQVFTPCNSYASQYSDFNGKLVLLHSSEGEWLVDVEATCTSDGSKHKECTVCHNVIATETIPAKGHNYSNNVCTGCGDRLIQKINIGLDAGHGLKTGGKQTPNGIKEWTLNDKVCDIAASYLSTDDFEIIRTDNNEGATDESLEDRVKRYMDADCEAFVSVHHNAFKSTWGNHTGVEVWVDINATADDIKLAECIYDKLVEYTGLKGRGIKKDDFKVIHQDRIPAVLVEGGFMDSNIDYKVITSEKGQNAYARAIAEGIAEFCEFKSKCIGYWCKDNNGWFYIDSNGNKAMNQWVKDSKGWCYVGDNGYCVTNTWKKDNIGWCYFDAEGRMATNKWVKDSQGWCYVGSNGYCATNTWKKDSQGWCYVGADGYIVINKWVEDSQGWCYVDGSGYCATNTWKKDSKGWVYLDNNGRMVTNKWVKDSKGWCYVGADGYAVTNCWKKDSMGWCYLDENGSMTKNEWVKDGGKWYYLDGNGYMVTGTKTIGGKTYKFNSSGVWVS